MGYISVVSISLVLGCHGFWVFCYGTDRVDWFKCLYSWPETNLSQNS